MEQNNNQKNNTCVHEGHCCNCNGCGAMCGHKMRGYYGRHFLVLIIGVVLAFFVGMKLGEVKGWMIREAGMPMRMHGWGMQYDMMQQPISTTSVAPTAQ